MIKIKEDEQTEEKYIMNSRYSENGNTEEDWSIFEILCGHTDALKTTSASKATGARTATATVTNSSRGVLTKLPATQLDDAIDAGNLTDPCEDSNALHAHSIDMVTTLRSELAALSYKKEHLFTELNDVRSKLCSKDNECEILRAQAARQSTLIASLQARLQSAENREQSVQARCDVTLQTMQREKRLTDEQSKQLQIKVQHLETDLISERSLQESLKMQLNEFLKRLSCCLGMEGCDSAHLTTECVVTRVEELMLEVQRTKTKLNYTCETLNGCESELMNTKSSSNVEKQRLLAQLESASTREHELEAELRQHERELQIQKDRLMESELNSEKLKDELHGFESRCHRLQVNIDRVQSDRLHFLRNLATQLDIIEPCETLIKEKLCEILNEQRSLQTEVNSLRDELSCQRDVLKETQQATQCKLKDEESKNNELGDRLQKCHEEVHNLRKDHLSLSEYLHRLSKILHWSECSSPPPSGTDTNIMAECLLERVERLSNQCCHRDHNSREHHHQHRSPEKNCCDRHHSSTLRTKFRRERSCHDLSNKESAAASTASNTVTIYNLQRRVRNLKEQVQRRDMHLELLKRKLANVDDGARNKCILQAERDEAACRAKKANKTIDKMTVQLADARIQISEVKAQLTEAIDYKITALERARKIDELSTQLCDLEEDKSRLIAQLNVVKERLKLSLESAQSRRCRDEALINSLRDDLSLIQTQLSDANHRLAQLQSFRCSVARTLHLRDLPETDLLQRLQALCSAHQEFSNLTKRYETNSPLNDHNLTRFDDLPLPNIHCRNSRCTTSSPVCGQHHNHH